MRKTLMSSALVAALLGSAWAGDAVDFKSTAVKYARINLTGDGAKAVVLAFDESQGTGEGYDILRVMPVGFEMAVQVITNKNVFRGNPQKTPNFKFVNNTFAPLELGPLAKAAGVPAPMVDQLQISYVHQMMPNYTNESFRVNGTLQKGEGADAWRCSIMSALNTADRQAAAPVMNLPGKLALKLVARPHAKNKEDIELGISTVLGEMNAYLSKSGKAPEMTVTVKTQGGEVVKTETGAFSKFTFG